MPESGMAYGRAMESIQMINILLVEDDQVDVMNVQRAFKKGNITNPLYVAEDGLQALARISHQLSGAAKKVIN
jgi:CheY-like chemotaxis protein